MNTDTTEITMRVPIDEVARDPNMDRQVRTGGQNGINMVEVKRLLEQEDPDNWGEITVRPWPQNELDQRPHDGVKYQVLIGNHRYVASRSPEENQRDFGEAIGKNLRDIVITVVNWDDDEYFRQSYLSNRGPAPLTTEDKRAAVRHMRDLHPDWSHSQVAKAMVNVSVDFVQRTLSSRNPNAARSTHPAASQPREPESSSQPPHDAAGEQQLPPEWQVAPASASEARLITVGNSVSDLFATAHSVTPAEIHAYVNTLRPDERVTMAHRIDDLVAWLVALAQVVEAAGKGVAA